MDHKSIYSPQPQHQNPHQQPQQQHAQQHAQQQMMYNPYQQQQQHPGGAPAGYQYPPMGMPPQNTMMMPPPQGYMGYNAMPNQAPPQQQMPPSNVDTSAAAGQSKSLHMRNIQPTWDEQFISSFFAHFPGFKQAKVVRDKSTGLPAGYGFIDFTDTQSAGQALAVMNGQQVGNTGQTFRLQWSTAPASRAPEQPPPQNHGRQRMHEPQQNAMPMRDDRRRGRSRGHESPPRGRSRPREDEEFPIFIGDIPYEANDRDLENMFRERYRSVINANIVKDKQTGRSKGFGFVRFSDPRESERAKREMNGAPMGPRTIRCSDATEKADKRPPRSEPRPSSSNVPFSRQPISAPSRPRREDIRRPDGQETYKLFIGGLDRRMERQDVGNVFSRFGDIARVDVPPGKGCAFVEYERPHQAQRAIDEMNGSTLGNSRIRVFWKDDPDGGRRKSPPRGGRRRSRSPRQSHDRSRSRSRDKAPRRSRESSSRRPSDKYPPGRTADISRPKEAKPAATKVNNRLRTLYAKMDTGVPGSTWDASNANETFSKLLSGSLMSGIYGWVTLSMPPRPAHASDDPKWGTVMEYQRR